MIKKAFIGLFLIMLVLSVSISASPVEWDRNQQLHFLAGGGISSASYITWRIFDRDSAEEFRQKRQQAFIVGFGVGVFAGASKELIWDKLMKKGTPEFNDFMATADGALVGTIVTFYLDGILHRIFSGKRRNTIPAVMLNPHPKNPNFQIIWRF